MVYFLSVQTKSHELFYGDLAVFLIFFIFFFFDFQFGFSVTPCETFHGIVFVFTYLLFDCQESGRKVREKKNVKFPIFRFFFYLRECKSSKQFPSCN